MNISKSSWHYRYNVWYAGSGRTYQKSTLCSYFWFTVYNILAVTTISTFVLSIIGVFLMGCGMLTTENILGMDRGTVNVFLVPIYGIPLFVLSILSVWAVITLEENWSVYRQESKLDKLYNPSEPKQPGLLKSYLKACKEKVCPLLTFR